MSRGREAGQIQPWNRLQLSRSDSNCILRQFARGAVHSPGLAAFKAKLAHFQPHIFNSVLGGMAQPASRELGRWSHEDFLPCPSAARSPSPRAWCPVPDGEGGGSRVPGSSPFPQAGAPSSCCECLNPPWQRQGHAGTSLLPISAHSSSVLLRAAGFWSDLRYRAQCSSEIQWPVTSKNTEKMIWWFQLDLNFRKIQSQTVLGWFFDCLGTASQWSKFRAKAIKIPQSCGGKLRWSGSAESHCLFKESWGRSRWGCLCSERGRGNSEHLGWKAGGRAGPCHDSNHL